MGRLLQNVAQTFSTSHGSLLQYVAGTITIEEWAVVESAASKAPNSIVLSGRGPKV